MINNTFSGRSTCIDVLLTPEQTSTLRDETKPSKIGILGWIAKEQRTLKQPIISTKLVPGITVIQVSSGYIVS